MKYTEKNPPLVCMQTQSTCYKGTRTMAVRGVLWHSTGANNPTLKRYVQPSDNDPNKEQMLKILGKNTNGNDWNHIERQAGLNAWIGKMSNGVVAAVQTMPWDYRPWGCGSGRNGSCNSGWLQFEICEDGLTDRKYFESVYEEAVQLTAYLCRINNLNPMGTVTYQGVQIPVILCHQDSYRLGMGSNHSDVYNWFNRYGKTMDDVRRDVKALLDADSKKEEEPDMTEAQTRKLIQELVPGIVRETVQPINADAAKFPMPGWAEGESAKAKAAGIYDETRPGSYCTRLEAAIMAYRASQT